jgi:hypothetical protein
VLRLSIASWLLLIVFALADSGRSWIITLITTLLLAVALFPPLEAIAAGLNDPNYRQQFAFALFVLSGGVLATIRVLSRWHRLMIGLLLGISIIAATAGGWMTYNLYLDFGLQVEPGPGLILFASGALLTGALLWKNKRDSSR